jgi:PEP-CTERM motif
MTISTLVKGFAGALTAAGIYATAAAPAGALTLINSPSQSDVTVTFTATHTESIVFDEGYQVNDLETLTNNMVTLSGGGPNLLGSTWQYRFAAPPGSSNSYTFNDGTLVPALGFGGAAQTNPLNMDTFYQIFSTVPGKSYTYSFDYSNNTAGLPGTTNSLLIVTPGTVPEPSTWAMLLLGFVGLGLAGYRVRRAAVSIA